MKRGNWKFLLLSLLIFLFFSFSWLFAQERELEVEYPTLPKVGRPETVKTSLPEYVKYIFNFSIIFFGLVAFGVLVWGGILYLISAGQPVKLKAAREQIWAAISGLILLLSSYLIFTTINPQLVMFKLPTAEKPVLVFCQTDKDCPEGSKCDPQTKRCVRPPCEKDEDCPKGYVCDLKTKRCVFPTNTIVFKEIPLGQMVTAGLWDACELSLTERLYKKFEEFFKKEIKAPGKTVHRLSDLNKYLTSLAKECRCEAATAHCEEPIDWAGPVSCSGDPCKDQREKIDEIVEINRQKIKSLQDILKSLDKETEQFLIREQEFSTTRDELIECLEKGRLVDRNEFLSLVAYYEKYGFETRISPGLLPAQADPLTFYCLKGGTIFDFPARPGLKLPKEITPTMPKEELAPPPLFCPIYLPLGRVVDETLLTFSQAIVDLRATQTYIEELIAELEKMNNLVSQCSALNCQVVCGGWKNLCYNQVCGCKPTCGDPPSPNPCWFNPFGPTPLCKIPDMQTPGGCKPKYLEAPYHGLPCPKDDIEKAAEEIKYLEERIFKNLEILKENYLQKPYILETFEGSVDLLNYLRQATNLCFNKNVEKPVWGMMDCLSAVGNLGPGKTAIADCYPQDFFCCTPLEKEAAWAEAILGTGVFEKIHYLVGDTPFGPAKLDSEGCPKDWNYQPGIKRQCQDTHNSIKSLLTCMAQRLEEWGQKKTEISSFTDSFLYTSPPKCDWCLGRYCQHIHYNNKRGKTAQKNESPSCHYGGRLCHQHKSYAVDIAVPPRAIIKVKIKEKIKGKIKEKIKEKIIPDNRLGDPIKDAALECSKRAGVKIKIIWKDDEAHKNHLHISTGCAYGAGCDCSSKE